MSIITLDDYKTYAEINNPKSDDKLQMMVDYANDLVTKYCATEFSPVSIADERISSMSTEIVLPNAPVISVDEVRIMAGKSVVATLLPEDIYLEPAQGIFTIISGISIPSSALNVSVDYTYGYSTAPNAVKISTLELVTHLSKREFNKSRNLGNGETATYSETSIIPSHIRVGLDLYRVL